MSIRNNTVFRDFFNKLVASCGGTEKSFHEDAGTALSKPTTGVFHTQDGVSFSVEDYSIRHYTGRLSFKAKISLNYERLPDIPRTHLSTMVTKANDDAIELITARVIRINNLILQSKKAA